MTENRITSEDDQGNTPKPSKLKRAWVVVIVLVLGIHIFILYLNSVFERLRNEGWSHYSMGSYDDVSIALDDEGGIWLGQGKTLTEFSPDGSQAIRRFTIPSPVGIPVNLYTLEIDKSNRIWVGLSSGLYQLSTEKGWSTYTMSNSGLIGESVQALTFDRMNRVWVGTEAGISVLSADGTWQTYTSQNSSIPDGEVRSLAVDSKGRIWVGTYSGLGLVAPEGNWPEFPTTHSGILNKMVLALFIEKDDEVWIGTEEGLSNLSSNGQWTTYSIHSSDYYGQWVQAIAVDGQDRVWITTSNELLRLDTDGSWIVYNPEYTGLSKLSWNLNDLEVAQDGRILIGTDNGLTIFDEIESANVQTLKVMNSGIEVLVVLRCLNLLAIVFLSVISLVQWRRGRRERRITEPRVAETLDLEAAFQRGEFLIAQGKRDQAINIFLKIIREGPDELRQRAIVELELLGEVEEF